MVAHINILVFSVNATTAPDRSLRYSSLCEFQPPPERFQWELRSYCRQQMADSSTLCGPGPAGRMQNFAVWLMSVLLARGYVQLITY